MRPDQNHDEYEILRDFYHILRGQIQHEDELINQRVTWTLTAQGFLFVAYSAAAGIQNGPIVSQKSLVCSAVSILGIFLCFTSFWGIFSALRSLDEVHKHFDQIFKGNSIEPKPETWWEKLLNAFLSLFDLRWDKKKHGVVNTFTENRHRKNKKNFPAISGAGAFRFNKLLGANTMIEAIPVACAIVWAFLLGAALYF